MKELIARLQIVVDEHTTISNPCSSPPLQTSVIDQHGLSIKAAIDALERLTAENLRLAGEVSNRNSRALAGDTATKQFDAMYEDIERLTTERDALRERLDAITKISALDCAISGEKK